jgi:hypothetical protein
MATRKKAKGKTKGKRKKSSGIKAATRKKTATVRETGTTRKKAANKAPLRRTSPKTPKPTAKVSIRPTPVGQLVQPQAVKPPPRRPAQPAPSEKRIGVVTHYLL